MTLQSETGSAHQAERDDQQKQFEIARESWHEFDRAHASDERSDIPGREEAPPPTPGVKPRLVMRTLQHYESKPVQWLEHERIALGKVTLLAGDPGLGKSWLTLDLAARASRGYLPVSSNGPGGSSCCQPQPSPRHARVGEESLPLLPHFH